MSAIRSNLSHREFADRIRSSAIRDQNRSISEFEKLKSNFFVTERLTYPFSKKEKRIWKKEIAPLITPDQSKKINFLVREFKKNCKKFDLKTCHLSLTTSHSYADICKNLSFNIQDLEGDREEIAYILAHELSHVKHNHAIKQFNRDIWLQMISLFLPASPLALAFVDHFPIKLFALFTTLFLLILSLKTEFFTKSAKMEFSRKHEAEADATALQAAPHIRKGMIHYFKKFLNQHYSFLYDDWATFEKKHKKEAENLKFHYLHYREMGDSLSFDEWIHEMKLEALSNNTPSSHPSHLERLEAALQFKKT